MLTHEQKGVPINNGLSTGDLQVSVVYKTTCIYTIISYSVIYTGTTTFRKYILLFLVQGMVLPTIKLFPPIRSLSNMLST